MLFLHSHLLFGISPTGFHFNNRNKAYLWQKNVLWIVNNNKTHYDLFHDRLPWAHRIIRKAYPFLSLMFFFVKVYFFFSTHTPSRPSMRTIIQVGCRVPQLLFIWVHLLNLKTTWCCTWGLLLQRPTLIYSSFLTFHPPKLYTAERKKKQDSLFIHRTILFE